ncbi:XRE family transcriptional regulator [Mesorhizobium sp. A623]
MADKFEAWGSGNVFEDLGLPEAGVLLAQAVNVQLLQVAIEVRELTPEQAAEVCNVPLSFIADVMKGNFEDLSADDLNTAMERLEVHGV